MYQIPKDAKLISKLGTVHKISFPSKLLVDILVI